jgi:hypothetical protein
MLRRVSLLSGFAALALIATAGLGTASATEYYKPAYGKVQLNAAPTAQHATSVAKAKYGDAVSSARNDNLVIQDNTKLFGKRGAQINVAPTTQDASSFAFAKKGNAFSDASNSNTIIQNNLGGRLQVNAAPTHQSARSGAVAIGGTAVSSASNSNVVSQGNLK